MKVRKKETTHSLETPWETQHAYGQSQRRLCREHHSVSQRVSSEEGGCLLRLWCRASVGRRCRPRGLGRSAAAEAASSAGAETAASKPPAMFCASSHVLLVNSEYAQPQ